MVKYLNSLFVINNCPNNTNIKIFNQKFKMCFQISKKVKWLSQKKKHGAVGSGDVPLSMRKINNLVDYNSSLRNCLGIRTMANNPDTSISQLIGVASYHNFQCCNF